MIFILIGFIATFVSMLLALFTFMGGVPIEIFILVQTFLCAGTGLVMLMISFFTMGIIEPFFKARFSGRSLVANVLPSNKIEFLDGHESNGMLITKKGYFFITPKSTYRWANGVLGGFGYFKYGATLPKELVQMASALKRAGIKDIGQLEQLKKEGKDIRFKVN